ncbi:c-type cytochrome [Methylorubrum salsuginis]|uniref:Cytochrome c n=1 Tax=Methylorubrum salsuginis TaxID=414703 RepID=A0A1I4IVU9_9HYPH|nr:cytochrome C [Methylorubrum salsuginis]SFL58400.1 cytochrome c [Methylorubrum salsuginis]
MIPVRLAAALLLLATGAAKAEGAKAEGDPVAGATAFRACLSCHALEPGRHMTGPSLSGIYGAPAGKAEGFDRYSEALAAAHFAWTPQRLDAWLANPSALVPGSRMTYLVADATVRADLIAYLKALHDGRTDGLAIPQASALDLKSLGRASRVEAVRLCRDTFRVTLKNGVTLPLWERNLRLRVDSSTEGPAPGEPALLPGGMQGDRYTLIFHHPAEISALIRSECPPGEPAP